MDISSRPLSVLPRVAALCIAALFLAPMAAPEATAALAQQVDLLAPVIEFAQAHPSGGALAAAPFPIDPDLVAVVMGYDDEDLIAEDLAPIVPVSAEEYEYFRWDLTEGLRVPEQKVGRRSSPNEVTFQAEEVTGKAEDYGLDSPIPQKDIDNAPEGLDPVARAVRGIADYVLKGHEVRVSTLATDLNNYAASNKVTLSGTDQWSDHSNSTPVEDIEDAIDAMPMDPNVAAMGHDVWRELKKHPAVLAAVGKDDSKGRVTLEEFAELFELDEVLVGRSRLVTSTKGQDTTLGRTWGKDFVLSRRDDVADPIRDGSRPTHMFTAQFGDPVAGQIEDDSIGLRGGVRVRAGRSLDEHISTRDLGYLVKNAVA